MATTPWREDDGQRAADSPRADSTSLRPSVATSPEPPRTVLLGVVMTRPELERSAILFALLFLVALIFVVGRTARDALFLTKFPVTWIAPMWMGYGFASSFVALGYASIVDRLPRVRFVVGFALFAAVSFAVIRVLIAHEIRAAYAVFYIWAEIIANLAAMAVWTMAQDLHDARSAKRLFGLIGAGRVLGTVVCGFGTGAVVRVIGTANLIFVLIAALLALAALAVMLGSRHPLARPPAPGEQAIEAQLERMPVYRSGYALTVIAMTLLLFTILTVGDYQFKAVAQSEFPHRDDLASFMANFYGVLGLFGIVIQLGVTPRLFRRYGVLAGMLAMPIAFVSGTIGLLMVPSLAFATALKGSDNGLQFTIHEASMQLLLFPFPGAMKNRVRTAVEAIFKPVGCGLGALLLLMFAPTGVAAHPGPALIARAAHLGVYTIPIGVAIVVLVPFVRRGYVQAMRRTLNRREMEPSVVAQSPFTRGLLREALYGADAPQVLYAIEQLSGQDPGVMREALPTLVRHRSRRVRAAALRLAAALGDVNAATLAEEALSDADRGVRIAAIETLAAVLREDAHDRLLALADSPDEASRTAAIAALVRSCGLDGMLDGAPRLRKLLDADDAEERIAAARVLGMVGEASLQRALAKLIADPEPEVRRAAVQAASQVGDPRLLPLLLDALAERRLSADASRAIAALGAPVVDALGDHLADENAPRAARLALPRILARIGTTEALAVLTSRIGDRDEPTRQKVLASASRLRLALNAPPLPLDTIRSRIDAEIEEHVRARDGYVAVRPIMKSPLLDQHLLRRLRKGLVRILRLCELAYPRQVVASVRVHLFGSDPTLRANAFEVLESLLDRRLRERLVDLVDRFVSLRAGHFPEPTLGPREGYAVVWLREEIARGDPYGAALALDAVAQHRITSAGTEALAATKHADPLVREAAAIAVAATNPPGAARAFETLEGDSDAVVREVARYYKRSGGAAIAKEDLMYTTIEKVLFLQRVPLFSRAAGDDLVSLARASAVVSLHKGDVVFREGDPGGALYLVISGSAALRVQGREVATLGPNDVFGEMSIFDREPRASTAMVVEETELLRVSAEEFHEAVRETVEIAEAVIQVLNRRLREADRRLVERVGELPPDSERPPTSIPTPLELEARVADEHDMD